MDLGLQQLINVDGGTLKGETGKDNYFSVKNPSFREVGLGLNFGILRILENDRKPLRPFAPVE